MWDEGALWKQKNGYCGRFWLLICFLNTFVLSSTSLMSKLRNKSFLVILISHRSRQHIKGGLITLRSHCPCYSYWTYSSFIQMMTYPTNSILTFSFSWILNLSYLIVSCNSSSSKLVFVKSGVMFFSISHGVISIILSRMPAL